MISMFVAFSNDDHCWTRGEQLEAWMSAIQLKRISSGAGGREREIEFLAPDLESSKEVAKVLVQAFPWVLRVLWEDSSQTVALILYSIETN